MNRCVYIFVLFALLATAIGRPNKDSEMMNEQKCIAQTGVDPEVAKGLGSLEQLNDEKVKCYLACMMKKEGWIKEDGSFNLEKLIPGMKDDTPDKEKLISGLTICANKMGDNECDTAHQIMMCMRELPDADK